MSSLRARGMMHRGPLFEFARLLVSLTEFSKPGTTLRSGEKSKKRGQIGKAKGAQRWPGLPLDSLCLPILFFAHADFFPFSPKAEPNPRLEFSGSDFAPPTPLVAVDVAYPHYSVCLLS